MFNEFTQGVYHVHRIKFNTHRKHCSFLDLQRIVNAAKYHHEEGNKSFDVSFEVTDSGFGMTIVI